MERRRAATAVNYADDADEWLPGRDGQTRGGRPSRQRRDAENSCTWCAEFFPIDKETSARKLGLVAACDAQALCKKCAVALFNGMGDSPAAELEREAVPLDSAVSKLGLLRPPEENEWTTHNAVKKGLDKADSRTTREVHKAFLVMLHRFPGGSLLSADEQRWIAPPMPMFGGGRMSWQQHPFDPVAAAAADAAMAARREAERQMALETAARREADRRAAYERRVTSECEAWLGKVLKAVERQAGEEQLAAARTAAKEAKQREKSAAEVRAVLEGLLSRVEKQVRSPTNSHDLP